MPRLSPDDKKAALLKRQQEIATQLKKLNAQERETLRKADTRRKVIAGALALEHLAKNPNSDFAKTLVTLLDAYTDDRSRHLFPFLSAPDLEDSDAPAGLHDAA